MAISKGYDVQRGKSFYEMAEVLDRAISANHEEMAYAIIFSQGKGQGFIRAAVATMQAFPDDEGIDFFTASLELLDKLVRQRLDNTLKEAGCKNHYGFGDNKRKLKDYLP